MLYSNELGSLVEAQQVRELRNRYRRSMTRHTAFITPEQQKTWFNDYLASVGDALYLYYDLHDCFVGYGYVVTRDGVSWGTLAVKGEFQGKGYGKFIYRDMIEKFGEIWIEIYADNTESLQAAVRAGFVHVTLSGNCVVMKGTKEGYDPTI